MTLFPGGPGWWQASDGRWYPPESAPPTVPGTPTPRSPQQVPDTVIGTGALPTFSAFTPGPGADGPETGLGPSQIAPRRDFVSPVTRSLRRRTVLITSLVTLTVAAIIGGLVVAVQNSAGGWVNSSLKVVGTPTTGGGRILVVNLASDRQLQLTAVDPSNGTPTWSQPFSPSAVTQGVYFGPIVAQGVALDLDPATAASNPNVTVKGISVATGKVLWSVPDPAVLSDPPDVCLDSQYFCLPVYVDATTTALVAVNVTTGQLSGALRGPQRLMSPTTTGTVNDGGLWQTDDTTPTFTEVSPTGQRVWSASVASLFGGAQYDPNYGWAFNAKDGLDIGSVGVTPSGKTEDLTLSKTVGISSSDGSVQWAVPGDYICGGGLQFLTSDVVCRYSGSAVATSPTSGTISGSLVLQGIDPTTGATTWTRQVLQPTNLSDGANVPFADGTHVVVLLPNGHRGVLNTETGRVAAPQPNQVFWCEHLPTYHVTAMSGITGSGVRAGTPTFSACAADGHPTTGQPLATVSSVGVTVDGHFVWPGPTGLQAVSVPSSDQA